MISSIKLTVLKTDWAPVSIFFIINSFFENSGSRAFFDVIEDVEDYINDDEQVQKEPF